MPDVPDVVYDLTPADAAKFLSCHPDTVKRWAKDGKLAAIKTPGGHFKFSRADLAAFLEQQTFRPEREAS